MISFSRLTKSLLFPSILKLSGTKKTAYTFRMDIIVDYI